MADYITLIGAESVQRASHQMAEAAQKMYGAADSFDFQVTRLEIVLSEFGDRLEQIFAAAPAASSSAAAAMPPPAQAPVDDLDFDPFAE